MKTVKNIAFKIQKQYLKLSYILLICAGLASCKKFVQIPPPQTQLVTSTVFNNDASATSAMLAIYVQMVQNSESTSISEFNGLLADEFTNYSSSQSNLAYYQNAMNTTVVFGQWNSAYQYIYEANAIIEGLQNNNGVSSSVKQQLAGEAKVIRAYWHFYLTNCYGDIPLAITADYTITSKLPRTSRIQILQQVILDLTDAQKLLSDKYVDATNTASTTDRVRPNKMVASALLARAYLYLGDYSKDVTNYLKAEAAATSVINNSNYSLISPLTNTNYVFNISGNSEAIWQLATPLPTGNGATRDGQTYILISNPTQVELSPQLLGSFEPGDNRKNIWVGSYATSPSTIYHFPFKYKTRTGSGVSEYVMVLRLAEQYLIRAEARAEQANTSSAIADLNVIRNRAGLANYVGATDKTSLLAAILHERQVELFCEWGHRWFDLNRTGNTNTVMSVMTPLKGGIWSADGHQLLYPIPQNDRKNNPNLTQNPGY
jgi:hypothetical protein